MDENLLLSLLHNNARMEVTDLAMALNESEDNVVETISQLEKDKIICGYHTIINWEYSLFNSNMWYFLFF